MDIMDLTLPDCLERLEDGTIRVAGHRVLLYHILDAVYSGCSISEIESLYPTISQEKISLVRDFCLAHPEIMRRHHAVKREEAENLRLSIKNEGPSRVELGRRMEQLRGASQPN